MNRRGFFRTLVAAAPQSGPTLNQVEAEATGMDRRAFLRLLTASTAVTTAALVAGLDVDRLLWIPDKTLVLPPAGGWPTQTPTRDELKRALRPLHPTKSLTVLTLETLNAMAEIRKANGIAPAVLVDDGPEYRLGDQVRVRRDAVFSLSPLSDVSEDITVRYDDIPMVEACGVGAIMPIDGVPIEECRMFGAMLEGHARKQGMNVFVSPPMPLGVEEVCVMKDAKSGLALRGMRYYDIYRDQYLLRFDMLGGKA